MPLYELNLILRTLTKPETKVVLKRAAESILNAGAILRELETLGLAKPLPYRMRKDTVNYKQGSYFLYKFHSHPDLVRKLKEIYNRDVDVIHYYIARVAEPEPFECTLHQMLQPPAYRPDVLKMLADSKKNKRPVHWRNKKFDMHVDIYPFQ